VYCQFIDLKDIEIHLTAKYTKKEAPCPLRGLPTEGGQKSICDLCA
jgi:hypothetical protein